jgi:hypothetical protein
MTAKLTTIYVTQPFDDDGISVLTVVGDPSGDCFGTTDGTYYEYWFREGVTWHRTKKAAIKAATAFREKRIKEAAALIARLTALPPPSVPS